MTPIANPANDHWLHELQDDLDLLESEAKKELQSQHPGARWRVLDLLTRAITRRRQIAELGRRS